MKSNIKRLLSIGVLLASVLFPLSSTFAQPGESPIMSLVAGSSLPAGYSYPSFSLGSPGNPVQDVSGLEFTFSYDTLLVIQDYRLGDSSGSSFLNPDGLLSASISCDSVQKTLTVSLSRSDGQGKSGCGVIFQYGGVGIADNIDAKWHGEGIDAIIQQGFSEPRLWSKPHGLHFETAVPGMLELRDGSGKVILASRCSAGETCLLLPKPLPGLFIAVFNGSGLHWYEKFLHLP